MIAVTIEPQAVKSFMNRILKEETLDHFEVRAIEMTITTRISINGIIEPETPSEEPTEGTKPTPPTYTTWATLRPLLFAIIKTGAKPKQIKIIFSYKATETNNLHPNAAALFLNMVYEGGTVSFTTATAQKEFALDKSLDETWDKWIRNFFTQNSISVTDRE